MIDRSLFDHYGSPINTIAVQGKVFINIHEPVVNLCCICKGLSVLSMVVANGSLYPGNEALILQLYISNIICLQL